MINDHSKELQRFHTLDFLRGIAAMLVVFVHNYKTGIKSLDEAQNYGHLGVKIFFVISGFIIPYILFKSGYVWKDSFQFLLKRMVRIVFPAWITLILAILFHFFMKLKDGELFSIAPAQLITNLLFIPEFFGYKWFMPIFWTLAIEFQFYMIICVIFPFIIHSNFFIKCFSLGLLGCSYLLFERMNLSILIMRGSIFAHGVFFVFGILVFLLREKQISVKQCFFLFIVFSITGLYQSDLINIGTGVITSIIISFFYINIPFFNYLGNISYSLYLLHPLVIIMSEPILTKFLPIFKDKPFNVLGMFIYTLCCIFAAHFYCKVVEKPFIKYSANVKYLFKENNIFKPKVNKLL